VIRRWALWSTENTLYVAVSNLGEIVTYSTTVELPKHQRFLPMGLNDPQWLAVILKPSNLVMVDDRRNACAARLLVASASQQGCDCHWQFEIVEVHPGRKCEISK